MPFSLFFCPRYGVDSVLFSYNKTKFAALSVNRCLLQNCVVLTHHYFKRLLKKLQQSMKKKTFLV